MAAALRLIFATMLCGVALLTSSGGSAQAPQPACRQETFEASRFTVCAFDARRDELKLALLDPAGRPYRRLPVLAAQLGKGSEQVRFAMNAGMFDASGRPIGLYVEEGRELAPLNTRDGPGNFHLKPNGVLWVDADRKVHVSATADYEALRPHPLWATQSGPMLVINGELHPAFSANGASRHVRNGVGVIGPDMAVFVISEDQVSLGRFARFFRDALQAHDALYLDGVVSSLWAPSMGRLDGARDLGPFLLVTSP